MNKYMSKMFALNFISLLFIELLFKIISFNTIFDFEVIRIILFTFVFSLITSFIFTLFRPLVAKILSSITIFILGLYALLELGFKNFMGNFMSLSMLGGGGEVNRVSEEVPTFLASLKPQFFLCLLPFVVLLLIFIFKKNWFKYEKPTWKNSLIVLGVVLVIHIGSLLTLNVTPENQIKNNKDLYKSPTLIDVA